MGRDAGLGFSLWEECYQEAAAAYSMLESSSARTLGCHKAITMSAVDVWEVMAAGALGLLGDGGCSPTLLLLWLRGLLRGQVPGAEGAAAKTAQHRARKTPEQRRCTEFQTQTAIQP